MSNRSAPITIDIISVLGSQLRDVIGEFEAFGVVVKPNSRLRQILSLLDETADAGAFPSDRAPLLLVGEAIRTAQEFIEVANVLPDAPVVTLQEDLRQAIGGTHEPGGGGNRKHLQFQSQLWVGAMMVQGGASTGVLIRPQGKNPDFVLENGLSRYAVEVKRPEGELKARKLVSKAAKQIRSARFHGGMIVVDLTDAIDETSRMTVGESDADFSSVNESIAGLTRALHNEIFADDPSLIRAGREHVFGLITFARTMHWDTRDLSQPYLGRAVATVNYWRRDGRTLRAHRARWLGGLIHVGISESGHQDQGMIDLDSLGGGKHGA